VALGLLVAAVLLRICALLLLPLLLLTLSHSHKQSISAFLPTCQLDPPS
jgi:Tfp pilus assembly protein PilN